MFKRIFIFTQIVILTLTLPFSLGCNGSKKDTKTPKPRNDNGADSGSEKGSGSGDVGDGKAGPRKRHLTEAQIREYLKKDPKSAELHFALALRLHKKGNLVPAAREYETVTTLKPGMFQAHFNLGLLYMSQEKWKKAYAAFKEGSLIKSKHFPTTMNMALCAVRMGDLDAAQSAYDMATKAKPDDGKPYFLLGRIREQKRNYKGAMSAYDTAIEKGFDSAEMRLRRGLMLMAKKKFDEALVEFQQTVKLDPKNAPAYRQAGAILVHKKKWAEALPLLQKAVELDPKKPVTQYNLGLCALNEKKYKVAEKALSAAYKIDPRNTLAQIGWGVAALYNDKLEVGRKNLRQALKKKRGLWGFLPSHFNPLVDAKKLKAGVVLLEELVKVRPRRIFKKNLKILRRRIKKESQ